MGKYRLHHNGRFLDDYSTFAEAKVAGALVLQRTNDINGHIGITDHIGYSVTRDPMPELGDFIHLPKLNRTGTVIAIDHDHRAWKVRFSNSEIGMVSFDESIEIIDCSI